MATHPELIEREPIVAFMTWIDAAISATRDTVANLTSGLDIPGTNPTTPSLSSGGQI